MTVQPKVPPPDIALREAPQPVAKLNRKVVMAGTVVGVAFLAFVLAYGLQPRERAPKDQKDLWASGRTTTADALGQLPGDYSGITKPQAPAPSKLGPPLPGDLGEAILKHNPPTQQPQQPQQRPQHPQQAGPAQGQKAGPATAAPGIDQAEAARQRALADEAEKAHRSGIFPSDKPNGQPQKPGSSVAGNADAIAQRDAAKNRLGVMRSGTGTGAGTGSRSAMTAGAVAGGAGGSSAAALTSAPTDGGSSPGRASSGLVPTAGNDNENGTGQNLQSTKNAFLTQQVDSKIYSSHSLQTPISPYVVQAGTVLPGALITALNSDLPGNIIGQIKENVYDSPTGRYLLIPQGSKLLGKYSSHIAYGQSRAQIIWSRLVMPNGTSIVLENLPGTDAIGQSGLTDQVDYHWDKLFLGALLTTVLDVGSNYSTGDESDIATAIRESAADSSNTVGKQITKKLLNVQPTITIRPGWPLNVIVQRDMVLKPYSDSQVSLSR